MSNVNLSKAAAASSVEETFDEALLPHRPDVEDEAFAFAALMNKLQNTRLPLASDPLSTRESCGNTSSGTHALSGKSHS